MRWKVFFDAAHDPLGFVRTDKTDASVIEFVLEDWRDVGGVRLPFSVEVDDSERKFRYRFTEVSLNESPVAEFKAHLETR